jgi:hypothetical protein
MRQRTTVPDIGEVACAPGPANARLAIVTGPDLKTSRDFSGIGKVIGLPTVVVAA